jgi:hypothetical protein
MYGPSSRGFGNEGNLQSPAATHFESHKQGIAVGILHSSATEASMPNKIYNSKHRLADLR